MTAILCIKYRNVETGVVDSKIYNVIDDHATINSNYHCKQYFVADPITIFNEVEIVSYREAYPELVDAVHTPEKATMDEKDFFAGIKETLKKYIEDTWSPSKHHVIQHSSGFDSRMMTSIIREIYGERGDEWLGDVSLVCWGHENDLAEKIVAAEGWNIENFHPLPKDDEYFKYGLDFSYAWKGLNGVSGYPINNPDWGFRMLQMKDVIPKNPERVQVWAASWFNELFKSLISGQPFENVFLEFFYNCINAQHGAAFDFEFVQPLVNPETIAFAVSSKVYLSGNSVNIRERMMKYVCPNLSKFPRLNHTIIPVPQNHFQRTVTDYNTSWYGKTRKFNVSVNMALMAYNQWWAQWSLASLVEHLVDVGVDVK